MNEKVVHQDDLPEQQVDEDVEAEFGELINEDALPQMLDLWQEVSTSPVAPEQIADLKLKYYPNFTDEQVALIEQTLEYSFKKYQKLAKWIGQLNETYLSLTDFGVERTASLESRLAVVQMLADQAPTNTAFASLTDVEKFLALEGEPSLSELLSQLAAQDGATVVDVGCGGQAADIQLLASEGIQGSDLHITGIGAFDYAQALRPDFPEFAKQLSFKSENVYYLDEPPTADLVFSVRTLPYTGVVDVARFCDAAMTACKPEGQVWISGIEDTCFDFSSSKYKNLGEYLHELTEQMPSLRFEKKSSSYTVLWNKKDGSPFAKLQAIRLRMSDNNRPYQVVYSLADEGKVQEGEIDLQLQTEPLLELVAELGFTETAAMAELRERFYTVDSEDEVQMKHIVDQYLELAHDTFAADKSHNASLAVSILLTVLYLSQQSEFVYEVFEEACLDALNLASQNHQDLVPRLQSLFERL